jgi:hypothetical protein
MSISSTLVVSVCLSFTCYEKKENATVFVIIACGNNDIYTPIHPIHHNIIWFCVYYARFFFSFGHFQIERESIHL